MEEDKCYDGAATMAGHKTGLATQIKALNGKYLFTHCYGHALNLAVGDSIKAVSCLNETFHRSGWRDQQTGKEVTTERHAFE